MIIRLCELNNKCVHGYTHGAHKEPLHLLFILLVFVFSILFFLAFHIIFPSYICPLFLFCSTLALNSFFYLFQSILSCLFISFFTSHLLLHILPLLQCFPSLFLIIITHKRTNREHFFLFFIFFFFSYFIIPFFLSFHFIISSYICVFFLFCSQSILLLSHPVFFVLPVGSSFPPLFLITKPNWQLHPLTTCHATGLTSLTRPFNSPVRRKTNTVDPQFLATLQTCNCLLPAVTRRGNARSMY